MAGKSIEKISLDVFVDGVFVDVVDIDLKNMVARSEKREAKLSEEEVEALLNLFNKLGLFEETEEE